MDNSRWKRPAPVIFHPLSAGIVLLAALALVVWSFSLDLRPMHNDEAVNGIKILAHHAAEAQIKASAATARAIALDVSRLEQEFGKRIDHLSEELRVIKSQIQPPDPPRTST